MDYVTHYQVTEDFQRRLARQSYLGELKREVPKSMVGWLLLLVFTLCQTNQSRHWPAFVSLGLISIQVAVWLAGYFRTLSHSLAGLKLLSYPEVTITLTDSVITYESSTGIRRYRWGQITEIKETKDFVCLMAGKIALLGLPKACFNPEALAFLKNRGEVPTDRLNHP